MSKTDYIYCLLFYYVNVTEQTRCTYKQTRRELLGVTRRWRRGMRGFVTSRADYLVRQQLCPVSRFGAAENRVLAGENTRISAAGWWTGGSRILQRSNPPDVTSPLELPNSFRIFRRLDSSDARFFASCHFEVWIT